MQELWVCERCKSINRAHVRRCYKCGAPKAEEAIVVQGAPAVQPVVTPGIDDEHFDAAWTLHVQHGYIPIWPLGYFAAALLAIAFLGLIACTALSLGLAAAQLLHGEPVENEATLATTVAASVVTGVITLSAIICHSLFLGGADYDIPAVGGGTARFNPIRAALWWPESILRAVLATLIFNFPLIVIVFIWFFLEVLDTLGILVGGAVCAFILYQVSNIGFHPVAWLTWPQHLLRDLSARLALPGQGDTRLISYFTMAWVTATGMLIAVLIISWAVGLLLLVVGFLSVLTGFAVSFDPMGIVEFDIVLFEIAGLVETVAWIIVVGLLAAITASLAQRLQARERWFRASQAAAIQRAMAQGPSGVFQGPANQA